MPIRISHIALAFITMLLMLSCKEDKNEPGDDPVASRTVLVYMAASNSLGSGSVKYDYRDIDEMIAAAESNKLKGANILAYHAPYNQTPSLKLITKHGVEVLKEYDPAPYSVSVARMKEVFNDMRTYAPARKYGLILWSHASGWIFNNGTSPEKSRSWGVDRGKEMSIPNLAKALRGEGFDYIYFDCCLMGNIETLYELRGCADHIVASPTETPLDGMPYDQNIPLLAEEEADLAGAAANTYRFYENHPVPDNQSIAISVYDMAKIDRVAAATRAIYTVNMQMPPGFSPQTYYQSFYTPVFNRKFYDLSHYASSLINDTEYPGLKEELNRAMEEFVIYKANTQSMWGSLPLTDCHGVSTFIYSDSNTDADKYNYRDLQWYNEIIFPVNN
ncbi:MAG: clostripain-related cysteine peptidase [Bacteroides sp.]|nr:clostripain-related cysteine peptidase [Bacteroides sp.]MCM1390783.1 clostripain-related cysteine peptidase [Bacteroides sp.]